MLKKINTISIILFLIFVQNATAQDSILLNDKIVFIDGLYKSFDDFKNNQPVLNWENLKGNIFVNHELQNARVEYLSKPNEKDLGIVSLDSIWGFTYNGVPYIKTPRSEEDQLYRFSALETIGKWFYFKYRTTKEKEVTFAAFNPVTNKPFRTSKEKRKIPYTAEKILIFNEGEIVDYDYDSLSNLLKEDALLYQALTQAEDKELKTRMMQCVKKYNERHPVFVKK